MKKVAVLLDLGFVLYRLYAPLGDRKPTADEVYDFAHRCVRVEEELFRIYCYNCPPFDGTERHPLTRAPVDFTDTPTFRYGEQFIRELSVKDRIAFRKGEIQFNGWIIKTLAAREIANTGRAPVPDDFKPDLKQKRVDIKIGLDVAWLSSKAIVDRLILVTADSDFVPAMKFARREGVQVVIVPLGQNLKPDLKVHADETRSIIYP
jgi:uncharacterized LabA/DUF88 family protein